METMTGYYGKPMIKPPEWTDLIPVYFWSGGMSGACATFSLVERIKRNDAVANTLLYGAACGTAVSAFCLIVDLKRPERFINMLRVFKPTSPMSMGVYIFSVFGGCTVVAAASEYTGIAKPLGRLFETIAAISGPLMSVYTAVLISDTVVPAWHLARRSMPMLFAATSASTASGVALLFGPAQNNHDALRLARLCGAAVPLALNRVHGELGAFQENAYKEGQAETFSTLAKALNAAGTVCAFFGGKLPLIRRAAGALLLAGGLCERFAIVRGGHNSAKNPAYTISAQQSAAMH